MPYMCLCKHGKSETKLCGIPLSLKLEVAYIPESQVQAPGSLVPAHRQIGLLDWLFQELEMLTQHKYWPSTSDVLYMYG